MPFRFSGLSGWLILVSLLPALDLRALGSFPPDAEAAAPQAVAPRETFPFEEPCGGLVPQRAATEAEQDKAEALAFFSLAHQREDRGQRASESGETDQAVRDYEEAIRAYQRALRFDPNAAESARAVIRLAARLKRPAAAEYAAKRMQPADQTDAALLRFMAMHFAADDQWQAAVELYERAAGKDAPQSRSRDEVLLWLEIGRLCHLNEDYEKAAEYLARVAAVLADPDQFKLSPEARKTLLEKKAGIYQLIGSCFLSAGRSEEAKGAFDQSQKAAPDPQRAALNDARLHQRAGRFEESLESLGTYFDQRPDEGLAGYLLLEQVLEKLGRQQELIGYLEGLYQKQPENAAIRYFLAEKYAGAKQFENAERLYSSLLHDAPTSTGYRRLLEIQLERKDYRASAETLAAVVEKAGSLDPLGAGLERLAASGDAVDAILDAAAKSLVEEPLPGDSLLAAAQLGLAAGRFDAIPPLFQAAFRLLPDRAPGGLLRWGAALLEAERYPQAAEVFRQGLELSGGGEQAALFQYYLAAALEMAGETDEALDAARQAIRLNGDSAAFRSRLAWVLHHANRKSDAASEYRAIVDRFDAEHGSEQARQAVRQARMILSNLCLEQKRVDEAVEWLQQVLDEFPEDPGALNDLGYLWADESVHLERARRMIEQAVEAEPDNAAFRDSLGWVLFRQGQYERAAAELEKAAAMEPDPVVLDHLGDAYAKLKQPGKAAEAWQRSYEQFKKSGQEEEAGKIRNKLKKTG